MRLRLFLLLIIFTSRAWADSSTPIAKLQGVRFDQNLGAQVPLNLTFISDENQPIKLGDYFHKRPVILILDYYRCPGLCTIVLNSVVTSLQNLKASAGSDFEVVVVSIDPTDTPQISAQKKMAYVDRYERPETIDGWHFLTGSPENVKALADTIGFHYVYDPASEQYAHPSGLVVLTPEGKTSRYFFGIEFPPDQVLDALKTAQSEKVNPPGNDFLVLCCQYNPLQGKYGPAIFAGFRVAGCLTVLLLAGFIGRSLYHDSQKSKPGANP